MSSLVANYSDSESEHSDADDDKSAAKTQISSNVDTEKKDINFLTAEFSESEEEGDIFRSFASLGTVWF